MTVASMLRGIVMGKVQINSGVGKGMRHKEIQHATRIVHACECVCVSTQAADCEDMKGADAVLRER